jgi:hypothetical protein
VYSKSVIAEFNKFVTEVGKSYKNEVNKVLLMLENQDEREKRYEVIEKNYPGCKPSKAKRALDEWKREVA